MVYVINCDGKALMPCASAIARLLLKQGKAKCMKRTPFTIKLLYLATSYTQNITLGIDTGSGTMMVFLTCMLLRIMVMLFICRKSRLGMIFQTN